MNDNYDDNDNTGNDDSDSPSEFRGGVEIKAEEGSAKEGVGDDAENVLQNIDQNIYNNGNNIDVDTGVSADKDVTKDEEEEKRNKDRERQKGGETFNKAHANSKTECVEIVGISTHESIISHTTAEQSRSDFEGTKMEKWNYNAPSQTDVCCDNRILDATSDSPSSECSVSTDCVNVRDSNLFNTIKNCFEIGVSVLDPGPIDSKNPIVHSQNNTNNTTENSTMENTESTESTENAIIDSNNCSSKNYPIKSTEQIITRPIRNKILLTDFYPHIGMIFPIAYSALGNR